MLTKFWGLTWIELKIYLRDATSIFWTFLFPFLLLFIFVTINGDENENFIATQVEIVSPEGSAYAQPLANDIAQVLDDVSLPINVKRVDASQVTESINKNTLVIRFSNGFDAQFENSQANNPPAKIEVMHHRDASDSTLAVLSILNNLNNQFNIDQNRWLLRSTVKLTAVGEPSKDHSLSAEQFLVTGLIGMSLLSICLFSFSVLLVQMRASNAFKMYQVLPLSPLFYLMAFITSRLVIMVVFSAVFIGVADMIYTLDLRYSISTLLYFLLAIMLVSVTFLSLGILLASRTSSVSTANGVSNLLYFPLIFLSDLFFPVTSAHPWIDQLASFFPLKGSVEMMRGILFNEGSLMGYTHTLATLLIWTVIALLITQRCFVWNRQS